MRTYLRRGIAIGMMSGGLILLGNAVASADTGSGPQGLGDTVSSVSSKSYGDGPYGDHHNGGDVENETGDAEAEGDTEADADGGSGGDSGDGGDATSTNTAVSGDSGDSGATGGNSMIAALPPVIGTVVSREESFGMGGHHHGDRPSTTVGSGDSGDTGNTGDTGDATNCSSTTGGNSGAGGNGGDAYAEATGWNHASSGTIG